MTTRFECPLEFTGRDEIDDIVDQLPVIELIPESYFFGRRAHFLKKLGDKGTPVVMHSVDLSLGTDEPLKSAHLEQVRRVMDQVNTVVYSDHLCMTSAGGIEIGQLTTLPFSTKIADIVAKKIDTIQKSINVPFMIENITNRFLFPDSDLTEPEFLNRVLHRTGCGLLLDITNTYINSVNHKFDPIEWLEEVDLSYLMGVHLAGGIREGGFVYDTHSRAVHARAWDLLDWVCGRAMPAATIVEWDQDTPTLDRLMREVGKAEKILASHTRSAVGSARSRVLHRPSVEAGVAL